jgi:hypothetical protein
VAVAVPLEEAATEVLVVVLVDAQMPGDDEIRAANDDGGSLLAPHGRAGQPLALPASPSRRSRKVKGER